MRYTAENDKYPQKEDEMARKPIVKRTIYETYGDYLKMIAGVVGSIGIIFTGLWSVGLAPVTNSKTVEIVEHAIIDHQKEVVQNFKEDLSKTDQKLKDLDTSVKGLSESNVRVDERTKQIIDEQKQQRDIQNRILMELQNRGVNTQLH